MADVNGDGKPDLITANAASNDVSVLLGNGDGTFQTARNYPVGQDPLSVVVADVNGDGKPDLVVANASPELLVRTDQFPFEPRPRMDPKIFRVYVLLGNGDGTFQPALLAPPPLVDRDTTTPELFQLRLGREPIYLLHVEEPANRSVGNRPAPRYASSWQRHLALALGLLLGPAVVRPAVTCAARQPARDQTSAATLGRSR